MIEINCLIKNTEHFRVYHLFPFNVFPLFGPLIWKQTSMEQVHFSSPHYNVSYARFLSSMIQIIELPDPLGHLNILIF